MNKHIYIEYFLNLSIKPKYNITTTNNSSLDSSVRINNPISLPTHDFQYAIVLRPLLNVDLNEVAFGDIVHLFYFELVNVMKYKLKHLGLCLNHVLYLNQVAITE